MLLYCLYDWGEWLHSKYGFDITWYERCWFWLLKTSAYQTKRTQFFFQYIYRFQAKAGMTRTRTWNSCWGRCWSDYWEVCSSPGWKTRFFSPWSQHSSCLQVSKVRISEHRLNTQYKVSGHVINITTKYYYKSDASKWRSSWNLQTRRLQVQFWQGLTEWLEEWLELSQSVWILSQYFGSFLSSTNIFAGV